MPLYYTSRNHVSHAMTPNDDATYKSKCGTLWWIKPGKITPEPQGRMCRVCQAAIEAEARHRPKTTPRWKQKHADELARVEEWKRAAQR